MFYSYNDFLTGILCPVRSLGRVFTLSPSLLVCIFQGRHSICVIYMKKLDVRSLFHSYNDFLTGILCPVRSLGRVFPLTPPLLVCIFQGRHSICVIYMKKLDVRSLFHSYSAVEKVVWKENEMKIHGARYVTFHRHARRRRSHTGRRGRTFQSWGGVWGGRRKVSSAG